MKGTPNYSHSRQEWDSHMPYVYMTEGAQFLPDQLDKQLYDVEQDMDC